ncbi:MAG: tetratricopeptide repeat protein [Burkholderiales bacterium]
MATSLPIADLMRQASELQRTGRLGDAERVVRIVLDAAPDFLPALQLLGVLAAQGGNLRAAHDLLLRAVELDPASATGQADLATVLNLLGQREAALARFDIALRLRPGWFEVLANRAALEIALGQHDTALRTCDEALARNAQWPEAWNNRGVALMGLGRSADALAAFERALACAPRVPNYLNGRASALVALGRCDEALASCDAALVQAPNDTDLLVTRGIALYELGRHEDAVTTLDRAIAVRPDFSRALQNRGVALAFLRRHEDAARDLRRALALQPALPYAAGSLLRSQLQMCDWPDLAARRDDVTRGVRAGLPVCDPFTFLAIANDPDDALVCAKVWSARYPVQAGAHGATRSSERIRIAYLSSDLQEHATAYLVAEMLELHDRNRFEVAAVSWGRADASPMRARLVAACDRFHSVAGMSDAAVAAWIAEWGADIAVDLKGYTMQGRPGILARRPAPVQVSFLGYPGTMASTAIDYLIADPTAPTVIPADADRCYTERVVRLPDTYQPNDRQRPIASTSSRADYGLPASGFVFCCFNNSYKLMPEQFDAWMRLLREVEGSVLWLLEGHPRTAGNLRREATARGVAESRLVFAPRMPVAEHLARHRAADLFLDTLSYNAHTTASDALWAGLPVLTCLGGTFAGRVAGSLVRAAGLPELVVETMADYEALALALARDPARLATLRRRLHDQRMTCALFDSERYTRHLESAYETMVARSRAGEAPAAFAVPSLV